MKRSLQWAKLLLLIPLGLGVYGFVFLEGVPILDALFKSVTMYVLNYGDTPPNFLVEAARWTAPLATASGVALAVSSLREWAVAGWKYLRGDSVAVYGPEEEKAPILTQLGHRGIDGHDTVRKADRYILLGNERENFDFYQANAGRFRGHQVYIRSSLPAQSVSRPDLKLFCPEEIAARLYWRQRDLYGLWQAAGGTVRIVFLGFGRLGEELVSQGLQNNLFSPDQRIEYHIFGECTRFLATHTSLSMISDPVIGHGEPWFQALPLLEKADLMLVLRQEDQPALLQALLSALTRQQIDVFSTQEPALELLAQRERLNLFPWQEQAQKLPYMMDDTLDRRAKRINLRYSHLYRGVEENEENMEKEWTQLDAFTRYSNISAADYHESRLQQLKAQGLPCDFNALTPETVEQLTELEHIRWCRYHFLNNWRPGSPENGQSKDPARRIHSLLCPYGALSETEKEKDRENIRILLSMTSNA